MKRLLYIGACQTLEIIGDIDSAVKCILDFSAKAELQKVDLLLFPECFLQGYIVKIDHFSKHAIEINSASFQEVLKRLQHIKITIIFGLIEANQGKYYNSAVIVKDGEVKGVYRKTHLLPGESLFHLGDTFPVFEIKDIKYGINICYDTQFAKAANKIAKQGAKILLVPAQNMMKIESAEKWKDHHNKIRSERAKETNMWLISSDVTGQRGDTHIAYGPTSVINPQGKVVTQVPFMEVGMISYGVSC